MSKSIPFALLAVVGIGTGVVAQSGPLPRRKETAALHWTEAKVFSAMPRFLGGCLSSVSWVGVIFEYADRNADPHLADALMPSVLFASRMDRQWNVPARFAILALPVCPDHMGFKGFREIIDSSLARNPDDWRTRLFFAEQQSDCGESHATLAPIVLPLSRCDSCPSWVRTYPVGFLGKTLSAETRLTMLLEVREASFSRNDRVRIDKRIRRIIEESRSADGFDSRSLVDALLAELDVASLADAANIRRQLLLMARPDLPPPLLRVFERLSASAVGVTTPGSGSSKNP